MFSWIPKLNSIKPEQKPKNAEPKYFVSQFQKISELKSEPNGIINLEIDGVLLDFDESYDTGQIKITNLEEIRQVLKYAIENNILVIITSNRNYFYDSSSGFSSRQILAHLGIKGIHSIYFTDDNSKSTVLDLQIKKYFGGNHSEVKRIAIVDTEDLKDCEAYCTIKANSNDKIYLTKIKMFCDFCIALNNPNKFELKKTSDNIYHYAPKPPPRSSCLIM